MFSNRGAGGREGGCWLVVLAAVPPLPMLWGVRSRVLGCRVRVQVARVQVRGGGLSFVGLRFLEMMRGPFEVYRYLWAFQGRCNEYK